MSVDWQKYEQQPKRNQYKKDWYQRNKEDRKIKDYRASGLNFIRNHSEMKDLREFKGAISDRRETLKNESDRQNS